MFQFSILKTCFDLETNFDLVSHCANFGTWFKIHLAFRLNWYLVYIIFFSYPMTFFLKIRKFRLFRFLTLTLKTCLDLDKFWPRPTLCEIWYMIHPTSTFRMALILSMHTMKLLFAYWRKKAADPIGKAYGKKSLTIGCIDSKSIEIRKKYDPFERMVI